jgi:hypothetical protein
MNWLVVEILVIGIVAAVLFVVVDKNEQHFPHATLLKTAILVVGGVTILHKLSLLRGMI